MASVNASTPSDGTKRRGRPKKNVENAENISFLSPIPKDPPHVEAIKNYPKRERKKKIWDDYETDENSSKANSEGDQSKSESKSETRGRGRPRKVENDDSVDESGKVGKDVQEGTPKKKGRGRPRKVAVETKNDSENVRDESEDKMVDAVPEEQVSQTAEMDKFEYEMDSENTSLQGADYKMNNEKAKPGKKRGRPPKKRVLNDSDLLDDTLDSIVDSEANSTESVDQEKCNRQESPVSTLVKTENTVGDSASIVEKETEAEVNETQVKKKRGRPKRSEKSVLDNSVKVDNESETRVPRKVGRPKGSGNHSKAMAYKDESYSDEGGSEEEELTKRGSVRKKPGRKRKRVDYSALDEGEAEDEEGEDNGRGKKRRKLERSFKETDAETVSDDEYRLPSKKAKTTPKPKKSIECRRCSYVASSVPDIRKHMACEHQLWWTEENPDGGDTRPDLAQVFKIKKFLNCVKCGKQVNQLFYYYNHLEWCGREDLTFYCEMCGHDGLKLRWKKMHMVQCTRVLLRNDEDEEKDKEESKSSADENQEELGQRNKRKAARKAMSMVHDLSKNMETEDGDFSDDIDDPDAEIEDQEEVEEESDEDDEDIDENEEELDEEEDTESVADNGDGTDRKKKKKDGMKTGIRSQVNFNRQAIMYNEMLTLMRQRASDVVFPEWLPRKQDWQILSARDSEPYQPKFTQSVSFRFQKKGQPKNLGLYETAWNNGMPLFYTGLSVWHVAWCPVPVNCSDVQYLAVTGKTDPAHEIQSGLQHSCPGVIQLWRTGIRSKENSKHSPKLCLNIAHNYGFATDIKWCATGCYRSNKADADTYTRLGLLVVSFTDGSLRIFSVPSPSEIPASSDERVPTIKPKPVLTLLPQACVDSNPSLTCTCCDWLNKKGHKKIIAGYSNGTVSVFNLSASSPFQLQKSSQGNSLLPYFTFQPHGKMIRCVKWCGMLENIVATGSNDFESFFWDLDNTSQPIYGEMVSPMPTHLDSSLWFHGVFMASEDNYAYCWNKTRYIEGPNMSYNIVLNERRDELITYNALGQSATVWSVTYSNWLNYLISCDNRGYVCTMGLLDFTKNIPCCKLYKFRQLLFKTSIKDNTENNSVVKCKAAKCKCDRSETCQVCDKKDQSDSVLQNGTHSNQSDSLKQNKCENQSEQSESSQSKSELQSTQETSKNDESKNTDKSEADSSDQVEETGCYEKEKFLEFEEYLKRHQSMQNMDNTADIYDRYPLAALFSVAFNPNHLQCTWIAHGGEMGLVRLVNVMDALPGLVTLTFNRHK